MKIAVDTNVLVSAAIADGPPRRLLELLSEGLAELVVPELVLDELQRILTEKLGLDAAAVAHMIVLLRELEPAIPEDRPLAEPLSGDLADDRILAAALAGGADVLASGDRKHLLPLGEYEGMPIRPPQAVVAELIARREARG